MKVCVSQKEGLEDLNTQNKHNFCLTIYIFFQAVNFTFKIFYIPRVAPVLSPVPNIIGRYLLEF